jgi:hypothetical protein
VLTAQRMACRLAQYVARSSCLLQTEAMSIGWQRKRVHVMVSQQVPSANSPRMLLQVGGALNMVYSSGAPVMFVGCGQTYVDLKKLNVKSVVNSLLK